MGIAEGKNYLINQLLKPLKMATQKKTTAKNKLSVASKTNAETYRLQIERERNEQNALRELQAEEERELAENELATDDPDEDTTGEAFEENIEAPEPTLEPLKPEELNPYAETEKADTETQEFKNLQITDRIDKLNLLVALAAKRDKILKTQAELKQFTVSSDGTSDLIRLSDGNGNEFKTQNKAILAELIAIVRKRVSEMLLNVENQITV